jgi:hypothetical protein
MGAVTKTSNNSCSLSRLLTVKLSLIPKPALFTRISIGFFESATLFSTLANWEGLVKSAFMH